MRLCADDPDPEARIRACTTVMQSQGIDNATIVVALQHRALAYHFIDQLDLTLADFDRVLQLEPDHITVLEAKAFLLATSPSDAIRDGAEAVRLAKRAVALSDNAERRDTLAAAYAEAKDFANAVLEQERALLMPRDEDATTDNPSGRLDLYRQGRPFRWSSTQ